MDKKNELSGTFIPGDYISYLQSKEDIAPAAITPLKHQDKIDAFLHEEEDNLAKIYFKRQKYDKVLEIIRKQNLVYPEKNRYFADQIRYLEKLINNTKK
ncbi:hypothetical protein FACS1894162_8200 [Bacteroidia bacterium]|nr:hypothetical protein FACS1894162_8200 [Bacteroidia bacterium]